MKGDGRTNVKNKALRFRPISQAESDLPGTANPEITPRPGSKNRKQRQQNSPKERFGLRLE